MTRLADLWLRLLTWSRVGRRRDLFAVGFIVLVAICYLSPAFTSGPGFGPADLGRGLSVLTSSAASTVHNNINGDIIDQSVAWNTLNYTLIHHGHFPLWNSYSGNGLPEFLNFESAVLALPSLFGYLVPLAWSFTVIVFVKLLIAGLGTYWCARLLRRSPLASTFAGATFMLSGAFANWLGWSISGVFCWTGAILAGAVLCLRSPKHVLPIGVLGVSIAFAVYGGFPEGYVLMGATVLAICLLVAALLWMSGRPVGHVPILRFVVGSGLGIGLSAPLWLPGLSIIRSSVRAGTNTSQGIPIHGILLALAQGYDGLPLAGSSFFLARTNYFESCAYLGVIALALAGVAIGSRAIGRRRRKPVVVALALVAVAQVLVIYQIGNHAPVQRLIQTIGLGSVATHRALPLLAFVVALLGAFGLDELIRARDPRRLRAVMIGVIGTIGIALVYMWIKVPEAGTTSCATPATLGGGGLSQSLCESIRRSSLYGPTATLLALLLGVIWLTRAVNADRGNGSVPRSQSRPATILAGLILVVEVGTLLFAGVLVNTYSRTNYPTTNAVTVLARVTHGALIGQDGGNETCPIGATGACGLRQPTGIDFYPNINIGYQIAELGMHDPIIPKATFASWPVPNAGQLLETTNLFNPDISSIALARAYGVSYVLVPGGRPAPAGMVYVTRLENNNVSLALYRVPASGKVTASNGDTVAWISNPSDRCVVVALRGSASTMVNAHITDVPGWTARIGDQRLIISKGPTNDLLVSVPERDLLAGRATLVLSYLPRDLLVGLALAGLSSLAFLAWALIGWRRVRARR